MSEKKGEYTLQYMHRLPVMHGDGIAVVALPRPYVIVPQYEKGVLFASYPAVPITQLRIGMEILDGPKIERRAKLLIARIGLVAFLSLGSIFKATKLGVSTHDGIGGHLLYDAILSNLLGLGFIVRVRLSDKTIYFWDPEADEESKEMLMSPAA